MADYKSMYYELAGKVADVIELLEEAMRSGELKYMLSKDDIPLELPDVPGDHEE